MKIGDGRKEGGRGLKTEPSHRLRRIYSWGSEVSAQTNLRMARKKGSLLGPDVPLFELKTGPNLRPDQWGV